MIFATDAGSILSVVTGVLLVAMGVYIWSSAPRTRQNTALALFTAGWGANVVTGWILAPEAPFAFAFSIVSAGIFSPLVAGAGWVLARDVGGRDEDQVERRRSWWVLALALLPFPSAILLSVPTTDLEGWPSGAIARWAAAVLGASHMLVFGAIVVLLLLAALRYPALARGRPQGANTVLLLTFGLGSYLAVAYAFPPSPTFLTLEGWRGIFDWVMVVTMDATILILAVVWLRNIAKSSPPFAGRARWASWTLLTFMLASFVLTYLSGPFFDGGLEARGVLLSIARFLAVVTFTYAILRNQLLGIDIKLRWTLSRSTIAAIFITVFFVASEGAQLLFGQQNEVVGVLAAGALVFAIAPLQRAAERLAEKAVPLAPVAPPTDASRDRVYQAAVRRYLRDGVLSREDERELAHLAGELGLHAGRAMEIRDAVERETEVAA